MQAKYNFETHLLIQESALKSEGADYSKALKIHIQSDDMIQHLDTDVIEQASQFTPNTEERSLCQSNYEEKDLPMTVRIALEAGELQTDKDEVRIYITYLLVIPDDIYVKLNGIMIYLNYFHT